MLSFVLSVSVTNSSVKDCFILISKTQKAQLFCLFKNGLRVFHKLNISAKVHKKLF